MLKLFVFKRKITYFILFVILAGATFVRIFNVNRNLGFYFDQGRDALVIWNFWKHGDLFLIGPTTGIAGIFRGPWYYWLITPFYILGQGNPVFPAIFLSLTTVLAIFFLYLVAEELMNKWAGIIAATIASFSYYIVVHSRWLSNPTPMLLISILLLWAMIQVTKKKIWGFPLIGFLLGMALQFGSAAEIFYIPTVLIFVYWNRKLIPAKKIVVFSIVLFFISFIPQILFDILKGGVLSGAIYKFLISDQSFKLSFLGVVKIRLDQYWEIYNSIILLGNKNYLLPYVLGGLAVILANPGKFIKIPMFRVLIFTLSMMVIGMLFFQGNYGNVFDYYFSGYYLPMILFFSLPLGYVMTNWGGKVVMVVFFIIFLNLNLRPVEDLIIKGRTHFTFEHQKKAIEWIYSDAKNELFNVDVYVPPVLPYAYDYLFQWKENPLKVIWKVKILYTLYEIDPPNPDRLKIWLDRQNKIGRVEKETSFGGITVQKRIRL